MPALPPGPSYPPVVQTYLALRNPFAFLDECAARHGDFFTTRFVGAPAIVHINHPEAIREVFGTSPEQARAGEANLPIEFLLGRGSLLMLDGKRHERERRLLMPSFHGERMSTYLSRMVAATEHLVDRTGLGQTFSLHEAMQTVTLDVIMECVFGMAPGPRYDRLQELLKRLMTLGASPAAAALTTLINGSRLRELLVARVAPLAERLAALGGLDHALPLGELARCLRDVEALLYEDMAERRASGTKDRDDVMSMLMEARDETGRGLSREELRDEMITLLIAGYETTATTLTFALYELSTRPDIHEAVTRRAVRARRPHAGGAGEGRLADVLHTARLLTGAARRPREHRARRRRVVGAGWPPARTSSSAELLGRGHPREPGGRRCAFRAGAGGASAGTPLAVTSSHLVTTAAAPPSPPEVVVIGNAGIDTNVYLLGGDVDFSVEANFTENVDSLGQAGGYASRSYATLGRRTAFVGAVGDDPAGRVVREELAREGVDARGVFLDPRGTARSVNLMYRDGRRKNFYDGKGHLELMPDLEGCRAVMDGARLAHFNIPHWARRLLPPARSLGTTIACDIQDVVDPADPYRGDFIEAADILFCSAVNHPSPEPLIEALFGLGSARIIVVGMGAQGCALATRAGIRRYPPAELDLPVVDTNGAGDALAAGFLVSHVLEGRPVEEAARRGQIAARVACSARAPKRLITAGELERHYARLATGAEGRGCDT